MAHRIFPGRIARPNHDSIAAKRIAQSVRGSDVHRRPRGVAECFANFSHEVGKIRLGDERGRPQTLLEDRLGEDLRSIEREYCEQVERLGREMNRPTAARHLPGVEVENERAEDDSHKSSLMLLPPEFMTSAFQPVNFLEVS